MRAAWHWRPMSLSGSVGSGVADVATGAGVIWSIVLSAGGSTRMGQPKALLLDPSGRTFVQAIAETARAGGCAGVLVVIGPPHGEAIGQALPAGTSAVVNERPERGMLSSVQTGLMALPATVSAVLVWPVDIPLVQPETIRAILGATAGQIIVPTHDARGGHPLRLPRRLFDDVLALDPQRGLKALLEARADEVERLAVADPAVLVDFDTPEEYARPRG
jgi:molybdenum cofactor cytidylyltransferase